MLLDSKEAEPLAGSKGQGCASVMISDLAESYYPWMEEIEQDPRLGVTRLREREHFEVLLRTLPCLCSLENSGAICREPTERVRNL